MTRQELEEFDNRVLKIVRLFMEAPVSGTQFGVNDEAWIQWVKNELAKDRDGKESP